MYIALPKPTGYKFTANKDCPTLEDCVDAWRTILTRVKEGKDTCRTADTREALVERIEGLRPPCADEFSIMHINEAMKYLEDTIEKIITVNGMNTPS